MISYSYHIHIIHITYDMICTFYLLIIYILRVYILLRKRIIFLKPKAFNYMCVILFIFFVYACIHIHKIKKDIKQGSRNTTKIFTANQCTFYSKDLGLVQARNINHSIHQYHLVTACHGLTRPLCTYGRQVAQLAP